MTSVSADRVLVSRLMKFFLEGLDPWGCEPSFSLEMVDGVSDEDIKILGADNPTTRPDTTLWDQPIYRRWHAARVCWMVRNPNSLDVPIVIDNECSGGRIYPNPVIIDGWHRLFASVVLKRRKIPVSYGGREDLLNYLTGKTREAPEE